MAVEITIKTPEGNRHTYEYITPDGAPAKAKEEAFFAKGGSCIVYTVKGTDGRPYLLKEFLFAEENAEAHFARLSEIIKLYHERKDNYVLKDVCYGHDELDEQDKSSNWNRYQVFDYTEVTDKAQLRPSSGSIFSRENSIFLYRVIRAFVSLLHGLDLMHQGGFVHFDVKPANSLLFSVNREPCMQLLDFGSMLKISELVESDKVPSIQSTNPWYSFQDIDAFKALGKQERNDVVRVLDTTAATRVFAYMLTDSDTFNPSKIDDQALGANEALSSALYRFFDKGLYSRLSHRFTSVQPMLEHLGRILTLVCRSLPKTISTEKLIATCHNPIINACKDHYIRRHDLTQTERESVRIDKLLRDINPCILPDIKLDSGKRLSRSNGKSPLIQLLEQSHDNYIITAPAGGGKTTSLLREFLQKVTDQTDELYIYVSLKDYSFNQDVFLYIDDNSGFPFTELAKNSEVGKLTVFLDSYDEMQWIPETECQSNAKKNFWDKLTSFSNVRFLICSRHVPEDIPASFDACIAEFCALTEDQISAYLGFDNSKNLSPALYELSSNPLFLSMLKELGRDYKINLTNTGIRNEIQLLELYLGTIYEARTKRGSRNKPEYQEIMSYIGGMSLLNSHIGRSPKDRIYGLELLARPLSSVVDFVDCHNINSRHISSTKNRFYGYAEFSHSIFREYFIGKGIFDKIRSLLSLVDEYYDTLTTKTEKCQLKGKILQCFGSLLPQIELGTTPSNSQSLLTTRQLSNFSLDCLAYFLVLYGYGPDLFSMTYKFIIKQKGKLSFYIPEDTYLLLSKIVERIFQLHLKYPFMRYAGCSRCELLSVSVIEGGFWVNCKSLWISTTLQEIRYTDFSGVCQIHYAGSMEQWSDVKLTDNINLITVCCLDGVVTIDSKNVTSYKPFVLDNQVTIASIKAKMWNLREYFGENELEIHSRQSFIENLFCELCMAEEVPNDASVQSSKFDINTLGLILFTVKSMTDYEYDDFINQEILKVLDTLFEC